MVQLHIKRDDESLFIIETTVTSKVEETFKNIIIIQNGRSKIYRLCYELEMLCEHGPALPPKMHGLTLEQIEELKLVDEWTEKDGKITDALNKDVCNKRNGTPPPERIVNIIHKSISEAKSLISPENVKKGKFVTEETVEEAFDLLKGTVMIAYPMNLPEYDPIRNEIEDEQPISSNSTLLDIKMEEAELWFASKQLLLEKNLSDYFGRNEKSKVIVKLQKKGSGVPVREPPMSDEQRKQFMMASFKRQEELKKLAVDDDDSYYNSKWADPNGLKKAFHGLDKINWKL